MRAPPILLIALLAVPGCGTPPTAELPGPETTEATPPRSDARVVVRPVLLVPRGIEPPSLELGRLFMQHVLWAQRRYREMLRGLDTFAVADRAVPLVLRSRHDEQTYKESPAQGAEFAALELFEHEGVDRLTCASIYVVLFVGTGEWPKGGGVPFNGGVNTGGGIVVMAAYSLTNGSAFQTTLQHEMGHAFGLTHADAYGWDMASSDSIMSYNRAHHTRGLLPTPTPGRLMPEELRMLDYNARVFPGWEFDPERDVPEGYDLSGVIPIHPSMSLSGQPDYDGNWDGKE